MILLRNIEAERARNGLNKQDLAKVLDVTTKTYWSWINGITEIPSSKLLQMSKMWNVTIDYLLDRPNEESAVSG
jgi:transcriptional regulator with XRE-family HTH domain